MWADSSIYKLCNRFCKRRNQTVPIGFLIDINFYESQNLLNNTMHDQRRFSVKKKRIKNLKIEAHFSFYRFGKTVCKKWNQDT